MLAFEFDDDATFVFYLAKLLAIYCRRFEAFLELDYATFVFYSTRPLIIDCFLFEAFPLFLLPILD